MRMWFKTALVAMVFAVVGAGELKAQIFTPTYMAPRQSSDMGLYLSNGPGDFALEGIVRRGFGGFDLGVRAGVADIDDASFMVGGEFRHPVAVAAPIDIAVTGHGQAVFVDGSAFGFALGLTGGYTFQAPGVTFTPYINPRIGGIEVADEMELELLADIGFELAFSPTLDIRLGLILTDDYGTDFGIGFAWR